MTAERFHGLRLLAHCGGGAFGDVYYCEDISGQRMAVKIVSKKKLGDSWARELKGVVNYRKITENAHELLQIFHVGEDEEHFYYTMEAADSLPGREYTPDTLAERLDRGPLPRDEVFSVLSAIFSGIRTIHDAGFAHRDIKPDNILFVKGIPKLGDIGLTSSTTATTTQFAGTIDFLPPEVRTSEETDSPDRRSTQRNDLYAFGKVIYCAVTGRGPHAWPTIPKDLPLSLPFKLFLRLSLRLCDKDPTRRIRSVDELGKELSGIERKLESGETLRDKAAYRMKCFLLSLRSDGIHFVSFFRKHWPVSVVLLTLAVCAAWWYHSSGRPADAGSQQDASESQPATAKQSPAATESPSAEEEQTPAAEALPPGMQPYRNDRIGISLTVPAEWDIVSKETIDRLAKEAEEKNWNLTEEEQRRRLFYDSRYKPNVDTFFLDYPGDKETIAINNSPGMEPLFHMNEDELRAIFHDQMKTAVGVESVIGEVEITTFKGLPCIFVDQRIAIPDLRVLCFLFELNGKYFSITLTCGSDTYAVRKEQFTRMLKTMKFQEKSDPVSENGSSR